MRNSSSKARNKVSYIMWWTGPSGIRQHKTDRAYGVDVARMMMLLKKNGCSDFRFVRL